MQTLLDAIKQNKNKALALDTAPLTVGSLVQNTLGAKTGKANLGAVPAGSLGGQVAVEQTNQQLSDLSQKNQIADISSGIAAQELDQKAQQQKTGLLTNRDAQLSQYQQQSNQLLAQLETAKEDLNTKQKLAGLEQAGFLLAQQDKDYMQRLEYEGKRRRLDDDSVFKTELQKAALGDMYDLFQNDLAFKSVFNANQRDFSRQVANINIEQAIQIARAQTQQSNTQAIFTGAGGLASAGAQAYANRPNTPASTNTTGYSDAGPQSQTYNQSTNSGWGGGGPR